MLSVAQTVTDCQEQCRRIYRDENVRASQVEEKTLSERQLGELGLRRLRTVAG
jgi:hypothetical protein